MGWGFLDWVRGRPMSPDVNELLLQPGASESQLREMALNLLDNKRAYDAYAILRDHQERARPILEELVRSDCRFRSMNDTLTSWGRPRFDVVLSILLQWRSEFAVEEITKLVDSTDPALRVIPARLLAWSGEARFAPALKRLTLDSDDEVRRSIGRGISDLLEYGKQHDRSLDDALGLALYDYMRDCALRNDKGPGGNFAEVLFRIDRVRATRDFSSEEALRIERNWLYKLLPFLHAQGIEIPHDRILSLLRDTLAILESPNFVRSVHPSIDSLLAELLFLLNQNDPLEVQRHLDTLRSHPQELVREGAQLARERLTTDPVQAVLNAYPANADLEGMRYEHRVVFLVSVLNGQVCNGGWLQWIANSSGQHAEATLQALREIGASVAAAELEKVVAVIGPDGASPNQQCRMAAIDRMINAGKALPADQIIWNARNELRALIFDYAQRHADVFR